MRANPENARQEQWKLPFQRRYVKRHNLEHPSIYKDRDRVQSQAERPSPELKH